VVASNQIGANKEDGNPVMDATDSNFDVLADTTSDFIGKDHDGSDEDDEDDFDPDDIESEREEPVSYSPAQALGAFKSLAAFIGPHLSAHKVGCLLVLLGLIVETLFNVLMPLALKFLVDDVFVSREINQLIIILTLLFIGGLTTSIVAVWYEWQDAKLTASICADIRHGLFSHIQELPISFYQRVKRGSILSRFSNDMLALEDAVISAANSGILPLLELVTGIILLLFLNWQLGLAALLILPLVMIGPRLLTPRAVAAAYQVKKAEASQLGVVQENIGAQIVVKAFALQSISKRWFFARNMVLGTAQRNSTFLNSMVERSISISVLLLHLIILALGAFLTFEGVISIGTFVAFESVFWEITYNLNHLTQFIPITIRAAGAVTHMNEILREPVQRKDDPDAKAVERLTDEIAFKDVSFAYNEQSGQQLKGVSFSIKAGSRVAIVGPSGAGKSTILSLILRLYVPNSGSIEIDGTNIAQATTESLLGQMAVVFQDNILFHGTFLENIRLGNPHASDSDVENAARQAEIHTFIKRQPQGYHTIIDERGDTLSGGQRQRIAIARALIRSPALLLLDEATSALDQRTEAALAKTIMKATLGRTLISVTHRMRSIEAMDEIIVMDQGRIVQRGTHASLISAKGLYRRLSQTL
jgi:ATP-binding cassette subfamily B protein